MASYVQSPAAQVGLDGSRSSISRTFVLPVASRLLFDYTASSEGGYDTFFYRIDSGELLPANRGASGAKSATLSSAVLPAGTYVISIGYDKDGGVSSNGDWVRCTEIRRTVSGVLAETFTFEGTNGVGPPTGWTVNTDDARLAGAHPWTFHTDVVEEPSPTVTSAAPLGTLEVVAVSPAAVIPTGAAEIPHDVLYMGPGGVHTATIGARDATVPFGVLALAGSFPTRTAGARTGVAPAGSALSIANAFAPTALSITGVVVPLGIMTVVGVAPTITKGGITSEVFLTGQLGQESYVPESDVPPVLAVAPVGSLSLTAATPSASISGATAFVPAGAFSLSVSTPTSIRGARSATVPAGAAVIQSFEPYAIEDNGQPLVPRGIITLQGYAPGALAEDTIAEVGLAGNLEFTGFEPYAYPVVDDTAIAVAPFSSFELQGFAPQSIAVPVVAGAPHGQLDLTSFFQAIVVKHHWSAHFEIDPRAQRKFTLIPLVIKD